MKKWEKPEVNVMEVKMDENIATSGDVSRPSVLGYMSVVGSDGKRSQSLTYYTDTNMVINTSIPFGGTYTDTSKTLVELAELINDIGGCR